MFGSFAAGFFAAFHMLAIALLGAGGGSLFAHADTIGYGQQQVTICHKGHTITVGAPAVPAHLKHGDTLGPCASSSVQNGTNDNGGSDHNNQGKHKGND